MELMPSLLSSRPEKAEYAPYFETYIGKVHHEEFLAGLISQTAETMSLLNSISADRSLFRYGPDKWSIREVIGHLIDAERVFTYRALRIARGDQTPLPSFDHDLFVKTSGLDQRTWESLKEEFEAVRRATIALFSSFEPQAWLRMGTASNNPVSARALAYITAGHELHHVEILRSRYLV